MGGGRRGGWMGEVRSGWAMEGVGEGRVHLLTGH